MPGELVRDGVDVLQDHRVEAGQMLGEELVDRERDQRQLRVVAGLGVVLVGAQDEERHHVDRLVALQPHAQRAHVVRRAARRRAAGAADRASRRTSECACCSRGWCRPRAARCSTSTSRAPARSSVILSSTVAESPVIFATPVASTNGSTPCRSSRAVTGTSPQVEAARAGDLDRQRERLVRDGRARGANRANAGVARRLLGDAHRVNRRAQRPKTARAAPRRRALAVGREKTAVADDHDGLGALARFLRRARRARPLDRVSSDSSAGARMRERVVDDQRAQLAAREPAQRRRAPTQSAWPSSRAAESASSRRVLPSLGSSKRRDSSTSTTTLAPTRTPRVFTRAGRKTAAAQAGERDDAATNSPARRCLRGSAARSRASPATDSASKATARRGAWGPLPRARAKRASWFLSRPTPHQERRVDLIVLVVRAQHVHRDVHRQANGVLALLEAAGLGLERKALAAARQGARANRAPGRSPARSCRARSPTARADRARAPPGRSTM